jgi:hypothetical protein
MPSDTHALVVADPHDVARSERARVHDDQARQVLTDHAGGAERHHQTDEHADSLEHRAVAAGKIGVDHDQGEHPQHGVGDASGRLSGLDDRFGHRHPSLFDRREETSHEPGDPAGQDDDQGGHEQARDPPEHGRQHGLDRAEQEAAELLAPGPGEWELPECKRQPQVGAEQH